MEETPPAAPTPAPAPAPQSWTMTENGPVPTPAMVRAIQADVRRQRAQAAWEDDPKNRPAPGKRRRDGSPLKKRGRDDREVEELEAKLREMKVLRERVVEHIAVCKKYGYCATRRLNDFVGEMPLETGAVDATFSTHRWVREGGPRSCT